jgi:hypothetical protein
MKREEFIFTIGFQGNIAIIDGKAKNKYGSYTTRQLAEAGLFKPAFCSALYSQDPEEMEHSSKFTMVPFRVPPIQKNS